MTREEALKMLRGMKADNLNLNDLYTRDKYEALVMAIKALEQETCEDAISRTYIEPIVEELENICINGDEYILSLLSNIKNAPPVQPQPKMGHWVRVDSDKLKCSECEVVHFIAQYPDGKIDWCPNCGAKMQEVKENG